MRDRVCGLSCLQIYIDRAERPDVCIGSNDQNKMLSRFLFLTLPQHALDSATIVREKPPCMIGSLCQIFSRFDQEKHSSRSVAWLFVLLMIKYLYKPLPYHAATRRDRMLDFFKFIKDCVFLILDYLVGSVDKTPSEQRMALISLGAVAVFVVCFLLMLLKISPDQWSYRKTVFLSLLSGIPFTIIYFLVFYLCL